MQVEKLIAPESPGAAWGMTNLGPALVLTGEGYRVLAIFEAPGEAREVCNHGIYVELAALMAAHQKEHGAGVPMGAASKLVGPDGMPMRVTV